MTPIQNTEKRHGSMVIALAKSPIELQESSSAWKWSLIHAVIGIAGELAEADNASDREHLLEEAGDTLFYCRDFRNVLGLGDFETTFVTRTVTDMISAILDHAKRLTIYNYDHTNDQRLLSIVSLVDEIESYISAVLGRCDYTRQQALEHNIDKLLTGPNARYKHGSYSDLAAKLRSDKNPDNDDVQLSAS
jgi:hypothetical protein